VVREFQFVTFSTLYPNPVQANHGLFVEQRLLNFTRAYPEHKATVVAPVPWFPFMSRYFRMYSDYARVGTIDKRYDIEIHHPKYPVLPKVGMSMAPFLLAIFSWGTLKRIISHGNRIDFIDAHYFYPDGVAAVLLGNWLDLPVVITARGSDINLLANYSLPRSQIRWAARRCSHVITVSESLKEKLIDLGVKSAHITPLRNGVDLDMVRPLDKVRSRRNLGLLPNSKVILSVGNLVELKGHHLLIEALKFLDDNTLLLIVGDGPRRRQLEELAAAEKVNQRVRFHGAVRQEELACFYSSADVFALASSREGMANVWLESLACGTPVVTTAVGGASEIIRKGITGLLVGARMPEDLARAIRQMIAERRSPTIVRKYATRFSWDATNIGQAAVFQSAVENHVVRVDS